MSDAAYFSVETVQDVQVVRFKSTWTADLDVIQRTSQSLNSLVSAKGHRRFVLDISEVQFLSSAALSVFVTFRRNVLGAEGELVICGLNEELRKLFKITALEKLFAFAADEAGALAALGCNTGQV